jgi:hypothetical protein
MIDLSKITKAVQEMLESSLVGYVIVRNEPRNEDPNVAASGKGWIGIYRGSNNYSPRTTGSRPWGAVVEVIVEVQTASMRSGEEAEDRLQAAEQEVMNVLDADKKLKETVDMTVGYEINYDINASSQMYYQAAIITVKAEVRS